MVRHVKMLVEFFLLILLLFVLILILLKNGVILSICVIMELPENHILTLKLLLE